MEYENKDIVNVMRMSITLFYKSDIVNVMKIRT